MTESELHPKFLRSYRWFRSFDIPASQAMLAAVNELVVQELVDEETYRIRWQPDCTFELDIDFQSDHDERVCRAAWGVSWEPLEMILEKSCDCPRCSYTHWEPVDSLSGIMMPTNMKEAQDARRLYESELNPYL